MARDNVFDSLGELIEKLPEQVQQAAISATKEAVQKYGMRMYNYLKEHGAWRTEDGQHLRDHIFVEDNFSKITEQTKNIYFSVDWHNTLVNENRKTTKSLHKGNYFKGRSFTGKVTYKRNYSNIPATWHDLAYILASGRTVTRKDGTTTIIAAKPFLVQGVRRKSGWKGEQTKLYAKKLNVIAREFK